ncbi:MAG: pyruvate carboxylase subunit B [Puniceicoccales bacterium]|nr:pyruvate carboxylase subunit B [Puniceicoccales bacterium]
MAQNRAAPVFPAFKPAPVYPVLASRVSTQKQPVKIMSKITPVTFNNTVLRDGHQSLAATRMSLAQMEPIVAKLDAVGFSRLETWGGATIDTALRFLRENPFERLGALKKLAPKTPHMMLVRGQNLVGYKHYADDVVEAFINASAKRGMDVFRVFDALNDPRNILTAVNAVKKAGKIAEGVICYTTSPVHTHEAFLALADELVDIGCDTICIKDMSGLIGPAAAAALISGIKKRHPKTPVVLHSHDTAGLAATAYYAAVEAGVDSVDTSVVPFANGTAQPDTVRMLEILRDHPRAAQYDVGALTEIREYLKKVYAELAAFTNADNDRVDSDTLIYQVPGGMLSNFRNQLKELNLSDRFDEALAEIPVVRKALGWIPLVTPTSQIVGTQAAFNVKFGRWKNFLPQAMDIALGYYGRTPAPVDPEVQKLAAATAKKDPITVRPADIIKPGLADLKSELRQADLPDTDEYAVLHAMFPQQLKDYHANPVAHKIAPAPASAKKEAAPAAAQSVVQGGAAVPFGKRTLAITVNGATFNALVEEV